MRLQKTFFVSALFFGICLTLIPKLNAQQVAEIPHINSSIIIDGYADDLWNLLEEHPVTFLIDGEDYPLESDCSGNFKAFWNRDTLYVLIFALDNKLYTGDNIVYLNDGFEIYLDIDNTKDTVYTDNCYQFRFTPGSNDITGRWGLDVWTPPTVDFAIHVNEDTNRTIEAVFPLTALGKNSPVAEGDSIGFEIEILDNDGSGRDHVLSWNNNEHMAWHNPAKMGTIILTENTITSDKKTEASKISVYPNPVGDRLMVQSLERFNEVALYSALGQLMHKQASLLTNSIVLDINSFKPGVYILTVKMNDGTRVNHKLVKNSPE